MQLKRASAPFGAACSDGGDWFACGNGPQFVGCCTVDACTDRGCPTRDVRPATFAKADFGKFPDQSCKQGDWFVCGASDPPFMGCCTSNACSSGGCPTTDLRAGALSSNETAANAFEPNPPLSASKTSSPTTTSTSSSTPTPSNTPSSSSAPKVAGGIAGGLAALALIIAFLIWRWRRYMQKSRQETRDAHDRRLMSGMGDSQTSPSYRSSYAPTGTVSGATHLFGYSRGIDSVKSPTPDYIPLVENKVMSPPSSVGQPSREASPQVHPQEWPGSTPGFSELPAQRYRAYSRSQEPEENPNLLSTQYQERGYTQIASNDTGYADHPTELAGANENARI